MLFPVGKVMTTQSLVLSAMLLIVAHTFSVSSLASESGIESSPPVIQAIPPIYPPIARAAQVSGEMVAEVTVDSDGTVTKVSIVRGHKLLNGAVEKAASRWKFSPLDRGAETRKVRLVFQFTLIHANKGTPDDLGVVFWPPYKVEVRDTPYRVK